MTLAVHFPFLLFKHLLLQHNISVIISPFFDNFIQKMRYIAVDIPHYVIVLFIFIVYSKPKLYSWLFANTSI
nr:MAG TPA: hypothetical protein [Caudoviricetes sp.]